MDRAQDRDPIDTFLVERYWPDVDLAQIQAALPRLEAAAAAMVSEGRRVEHLGSILMPADQVVFTLIVAGDESLVRQLNERADLPADRIARAVALMDTAAPPVETAGAGGSDPRRAPRRADRDRRPSRKGTT